MDSVFDRIARLCKEQNISSEKLCEDNGISKSAYYSYRCGRRDIPPVKLKKIADYLGVSANFLHFGNDIITHINQGEIIAKITSDKDFMKHVYALYSLPEMDKRYVLKYISLLCDDADID